MNVLYFLVYGISFSPFKSDRQYSLKLLSLPPPKSFQFLLTTREVPTLPEYNTGFDIFHNCATLFGRDPATTINTVS